MFSHLPYGTRMARIWQIFTDISLRICGYPLNQRSFLNTSNEDRCVTLESLKLPGRSLRYASLLSQAPASLPMVVCKRSSSPSGEPYLLFTIYHQQLFGLSLTNYPTNKIELF